MRPPGGAATAGWGGALLTSCFQPSLVPLGAESRLCHPSVPATYAPSTAAQHLRGPAPASPLPPCTGEVLGGSVCPCLPSRESAPAKTGERRLSWQQAGSVTFPFRPAPVNHLGRFPPPSKLNKTWMLRSLSLGRRCSQKGLALDLPLCNKKQNLACFLAWEGVQYPSAEPGT